MNTFQFVPLLLKKEFSLYKLNVGSVTLACISYIPVSYITLFLVWSKFPALEFPVQITLATGFSIIMLCLMSLFLPFTEKGENICLLLLLLAIIITISFLYFYFVCGKYLFWFPVCYFIGLLKVAIDSWNHKRRKS